MQRSILLAAAIAASTVAGCGADVEDDGARVAAKSDAIRAGVLDTSSRGVVGVLALDRNTICSGVVVNPRVVLTARHCVSDMAPTRDRVDCSLTEFGATSAAHDVFVTTARGGAVPVFRHPVVRVLVPRVNRFCGADLAVLVLAYPLADDDADPVPLRLDQSPDPGELFTAIGIGRTSTEPSGTRRRREGLRVSCVGDGCGTSLVDAREWWGEGAVCEGDSGGPAVDGEGRVVGIASRKRDGCTATIYSDVAASQDFLTESLEIARNTPEARGCEMARAGEASPIALAVAALLIARARRREA